jgi:hypothetical protein
VADVVELDQFQIFQEMLRRSMAVAPPGWRELIVDFYVEEDQSATLKSYLIERNGAVVEESLGYVADLPFWMRKLQGHLAQAGRPPFTRCKIHLKSSGQYESTYGYDKVDWDALLNPDWNFFPKRASQ